MKRITLLIAAMACLLQACARPNPPLADECGVIAAVIDYQRAINWAPGTPRELIIVRSPAFHSDTGEIFPAMPAWALGIYNEQYLRVISSSGVERDGDTDERLSEIANAIIDRNTDGESAEPPSTSLPIRTSRSPDGCFLNDLGDRLSTFDFSTGIETFANGQQEATGWQYSAPNDAQPQFHPDKHHLNLSPVMFAESRRYALVEAGYSCGGLCGVGHLFILARTTNGGWTVVGGRMTWIS